MLIAGRQARTLIVTPYDDDAGALVETRRSMLVGASLDMQCWLHITADLRMVEVSSMVAFNVLACSS
jgi:hypothetical protein